MKSRDILKIFAVFVSAILTSSVNAFPSGVKISGKMQILIPVHRISSKRCLSCSRQQAGKPAFKKISLLRLKLSKQFIHDFKQRAKMLDSSSFVQPLSVMTIKQNDFKVHLGMENVPVLDQGEYGTCVTFAVTAVIDAAKRIGDYISQQCNLELGNALAAEGVLLQSGWDGGYSVEVLRQINDYGAVSHQQCPDSYPKPEAQLDSFQFRKLSQGKFSHSVYSYDLGEHNVQDVINALNRQHRVIAGILLPIDNAEGYPINSHANGLWSLSYQKEKQDICSFDCAAHEIIITGYDDKDKVFKVRNSWGREVGDDGEFYMTYDYYRLMGLDAQEIYNLNLS